MTTRFERAFVRLNRRAEQRLVEALRDLEDGRISRSRFEVVVAQALRVSTAEATTFGDVAMAALLGVRPLGVPPVARNVAAWREAAATVLEFEPASVELSRSRELRLARLGRAETANAVQDTMQVSMQANNVERWVRATDSDPCPLCTELADGVARPSTVRMSRHEGCMCRQQPVRQSAPVGNSGWDLVNPAIRERWSEGVTVGAIPA